MSATRRRPAGRSVTEAPAPVELEVAPPVVRAEEPVLPEPAGRAPVRATTGAQDDPAAAAAPDPEVAVPERLGLLWDRAQSGVAGLLSYAGTEGRALWSRAEGDVRTLWGQLHLLSDLPREEVERLWCELRDRLNPVVGQLEAQLELLGRLRQALTGLHAPQDLQRLRRRATALEFRIRTLEARLRRR